MNLKNDFTIKEVRRHWDEVAQKYEHTNDTVGYVHYQRFEKALEYAEILPGQKVLNIWSRTGKLIPYIRKISDVDLYNREASEKMLEIAKKNYPEEQNMKITDLKDLSEFDGNFFDRIISLETLEHTPEPDLFLQELFRVLKPDGKIVLSLPARGFELLTNIWELFFDNHGEGPHQFLNPKEVRYLLNQVNFSVEKVNCTFVIPLGSEKLERLSEKICNPFFKLPPFSYFALRCFYVAKKSSFQS